jgi:hypothetical protein
MVTITFSANGKKIEKTIEFTSNDTEKNAPVLTPDELKQLGDGKVNVCYHYYHYHYHYHY